MVVELAFGVFFFTNKESGSLFVGMELEFWKMSVGNLGGKRKRSEKSVALLSLLMMLIGDWIV